MSQGLCGDSCQQSCNSTSPCENNPCWFHGTCIEVTNIDYVCICLPNHTGKNCRTALSCQANLCQNGGSCQQLGSSIRCECSESFEGEFCQYKRSSVVSATPRSNEPKIQVEYRQFDAETLAVISNLASGSASHSNRMNTLTDAWAETSGNHTQFVFCLTNPCENGGTCFVTNTATTKVR